MFPTSLLIDGALVNNASGGNAARVRVRVQRGNAAAAAATGTGTLHHIVCWSSSPSVLTLRVPAARLTVSSPPGCGCVCATFVLGDDNNDFFDVILEHQAASSSSSLSATERTHVESNVIIRRQHDDDDDDSSATTTVRLAALHSKAKQQQRAFASTRIVLRKQSQLAGAATATATTVAATAITPTIATSFLKRVAANRHVPVCIVNPRPTRQQQQRHSDENASPSSPLLLDAFFDHVRALFVAPAAVAVPVNTAAASSSSSSLFSAAAASTATSTSTATSRHLRGQAVSFSTVMRFLQREKKTFHWGGQAQQQQQQQPQQSCNGFVFLT